MLEQQRENNYVILSCLDMLLEQNLGELLFPLFIDGGFHNLETQVKGFKDYISSPLVIIQHDCT